MKIYRIAEHYSVNRDDNELRVLACPKCDKTDIKKFNKRVLMTLEGDCTKLFQCNSCKTYFTFYTEDGLRDISKQEASQGLKDGCRDMQKDGKDQHGHSYYIAFTSEPPTIGDKAYDKKYDGGYEQFGEWKDSLPKANSLVKNKDIICLIDFELMVDWE